VHLLQGGQIGAAALDTTKGSAWGLLNAANQHIDHKAGRSADARVKSAWFGHGEIVKRYLMVRRLQVSGGAVAQLRRGRLRGVSSPLNLPLLGPICLIYEFSYNTII
jgi:hypothetical protein